MKIRPFALTLFNSGSLSPLFVSRTLPSSSSRVALSLILYSSSRVALSPHSLHLSLTLYPANTTSTMSKSGALGPSSNKLKQCSLTSFVQKSKQKENAPNNANNANNAIENATDKKYQLNANQTSLVNPNSSYEKQRDVIKYLESESKVMKCTGFNSAQHAKRWAAKHITRNNLSVSYNVEGTTVILTKLDPVADAAVAAKPQTSGAKRYSDGSKKENNVKKNVVTAEKKKKTDDIPAKLGGKSSDDNRPTKEKKEIVSKLSHEELMAAAEGAVSSLFVFVVVVLYLHFCFDTFICIFLFVAQEEVRQECTCCSWNFRTLYFSR